MAEENGKTVTQRFIYYVSAVVIGVVVLGAGFVYAVLILDGDQETDPPPAVGLLLGAALVQMANLVREGTNQQLANGIQTSLKNAEYRVAENQKQVAENANISREEAESMRKNQEEMLKYQEHLLKQIEGFKEGSNK